MPNLTAKELSSLEDQLSAVLSSDPQLKTQYEQIAGQHQNHYDRLLAFLN